MARSITPGELEEIILYYFEHQAMPDPASDSAMICAVLANVNRSKGKSFKVTDFLRRPPMGGKAQTTEEMQATFERLGKG